MKTSKKIKLIIAVIVAVMSLTAVLSLLCSAESNVFVLKKTPGVKLLMVRLFEKDVVEYQRLDSLIVAKNIQIDSLVCIQQKTDADKLLKNNYELIKADYQQQKRFIEFDMNIKLFLVRFMMVLIYLGLFVFAIIYICCNWSVVMSEIRKKTWFVGREIPSFFYFFKLFVPGPVCPVGRWILFCRFVNPKWR